MGGGFGNRLADALAGAGNDHHLAAKVETYFT
jgi:hypothetical protein